MAEAQCQLPFFIEMHRDLRLKGECTRLQGQRFGSFIFPTGGRSFLGKEQGRSSTKTIGSHVGREGHVRCTGTNSGHFCRHEDGSSALPSMTNRKQVLRSMTHTILRDIQDPGSCLMLSLEHRSLCSMENNSYSLSTIQRATGRTSLSHYNGQRSIPPKPNIPCRPFTWTGTLG
jgi:hypothetical protein